MSISRREKILLLAALYLGLVFIFYRLWYVPLNQRLDDLKQQNLSLNHEKSELMRISREKKQHSVEIQNLLIDKQSIEQKIPRDKEIDSLLEELQLAAHESGVRLVEVEYNSANDRYEKISPTGKSNCPDTVPTEKTNLPDFSQSAISAQTTSKPNIGQVGILSMRLSVAGGYYQLVDFLIQLEKAQRIICIQSLGLIAETRPTSTADSIKEKSANLNDSEPLPPASAQDAKGTDQDNEKTDNPAYLNIREEKAVARYGMGNMQLKLHINTFYSP